MRIEKEKKKHFFVALVARSWLVRARGSVSPCDDFD
jgi:hypothetical protein